MCYIIFVIFLLLLFAVSLRIFHNDILSPPIVMIGIFFLCAVVGLLRYDDWLITEYSLKSVVLLCVGILSFLCASIAVFSFQKKHLDITSSITRKRIDIPFYFVLFSLFFGIVTLFLFYQNMNRVLLLAKYPNNSISQLISGYRLLVVYISPEKYHIPTTILYCTYILTINSIFYLYVVIHNFCFKVHLKKDFIYVICVLYWPVISILNSSRYELLFMMAIVIYLVYFFKNMQCGKPIRVRRNIFKMGSKMLIIFLALFIVLTIIMGRVKSFSNLNVQNYLTTYISVGIRNFDLFVDNPPEQQGWGKETFPSIYRFLYIHFGIGEYFKLPLEYRSLNGQNMGNIYTCFRRYYSDFGLVGLIVLPFLFGLFITRLYYKVKKQCKNNTIGFEILLFIYFARCVFFMPIEDYFYIFDVSARGLFKIIILYILYRLFIKRDVL